MAATRDPGWNRDDIDFDGSGRLVIKNPELVREIQAVMREQKEIIICAGGAADSGTATDDATPCVDPPLITTTTTVKGPHPTNMCGCRISVPDPKIPTEVVVQPPKATV